MTRLRPPLLLPLLAIAACQTETKPLTGFDKQPPGILLDGDHGSVVFLMPIFALPDTPTRIFRPRLNGQDAVVSDGGFYDYSKLFLTGWTGGFEEWLYGVPPDTYVFELVDDAGKSWGPSAPLLVPAGLDVANPSGQRPAVIFSNFDGHSGTWTVDPSMRDADPATDEITVTNLVGEDVVVERCLIAAGSRNSCTPLGTVAPQDELRTVETPVVGSSGDDHQALFIHLASDDSQSYQRDLVLGTSDNGSYCQVERIIVHGRRIATPDSARATDSLAFSSCYGYGTSGT